MGSRADAILVVGSGNSWATDFVAELFRSLFRTLFRAFELLSNSLSNFFRSLVAWVPVEFMDSMKWLRVSGALVMGAGLLLPGARVYAQRGGGGGGIGGGVPTAGAGRPGGVEEKDELQGFHRAMAVQATSEQIAEFRGVVNRTEAARRDLDEAGERRGLPCIWKERR